LCLEEIIDYGVHVPSSGVAILVGFVKISQKLSNLNFNTTDVISPFVVTVGTKTVARREVEEASKDVTNCRAVEIKKEMWKEFNRQIQSVGNSG
jgi:hypothetical protein